MRHRLEPRHLRTNTRKACNGGHKHNHYTLPIFLKGCPPLPAALPFSSRPHPAPSPPSTPSSRLPSLPLLTFSPNRPPSPLLLELLLSRPPPFALAPYPNIYIHLHPTFSDVEKTERVTISCECVFVYVLLAHEYRGRGKADDCKHDHVLLLPNMIRAMIVQMIANDFACMMIAKMI